QTYTGPGEPDATALAGTERGHPDQGPGDAGTRAASSRPAESLPHGIRGRRDPRADKRAGAANPYRDHLAQSKPASGVGPAGATAIFWGRVQRPATVGTALAPDGAAGLPNCPRLVGQR